MKWMTISALALATLSPLAQAGTKLAYQECDAHKAYLAGRQGKQYLAQCDKAMAPIVQAAFIKGRNRYYAKQTDAMYSAQLTAQMSAQRYHQVWSSGNRSSGERIAESEYMNAVTFAKPTVKRIEPVDESDAKDEEAPPVEKAQ